MLVVKMMEFNVAILNINGVSPKLMKEKFKKDVLVRFYECIYIFLQKKLYTYATIPAVLKCHKDVKSDMLFSILIGNTYLNIFICIRVVHVQSTDD